MEKRKRFYIALALYAVLGLLIWTTIDNIPIPVSSTLRHQLANAGIALHITLRQVTLMILMLFVLRTALHRYAERIQEERESKQGSS
jgi:hypothetical protein